RLDVLHVEADVDRSHAVGEVADRDHIDPSLSNGDDRPLVDTTGGFGDGAAVHQLQPGLDLVEVHVVEHDHLDPAVERFLHHVQRLALYLELEGVLGARPQDLDCVADATGDLDVVVLHQNAIAQAENVVVGAAAAHGIFLQHAQSGPALAGVGDAHLRVLDQVDIAPGLGGDPGHLLDPIKRAALDHEKGGGLGFDLEQDLARPNVLTVFHHVLDAGVGIDGADGLVCQQETADYAAALNIDLRSLHRVLTHKKTTSGVARTDLVAQRLLDIWPDHESIELHVRISSSMGSRCSPACASASSSV